MALSRKTGLKYLETSEGVEVNEDLLPCRGRPPHSKAPQPPVGPSIGVKSNGDVVLGGQSLGAQQEIWLLSVIYDNTGDSFVQYRKIFDGKFKSINVFKSIELEKAMVFSVGDRPTYKFVIYNKTNNGRSSPLVLTAYL